MCHNECTLPCRVTACNAVKFNAVNNIERYLVLSVSLVSQAQCSMCLLPRSWAPFGSSGYPFFFPTSIFLLRLVSDKVGGGGGGGSVNSWKAVSKVEAPGVQKTKPQRFIVSQK